MIIKRYLFELASFLGEQGVVRTSEWISDEWLAQQMAIDPSLDRLVELQDPIAGYPLRGVARSSTELKGSNAD